MKPLKTLKKELWSGERWEHLYMFDTLNISRPCVMSVYGSICTPVDIAIMESVCEPLDLFIRESLK